MNKGNPLLRSDKEYPFTFPAMDEYLNLDVEGRMATWRLRLPFVIFNSIKTYQDASLQNVLSVRINQ